MDGSNNQRELREVRCPNCGRLIAQEQMTGGTLRVRCPRCGAFVIVSREDNQAGGTIERPERPQPVAP